MENKLCGFVRKEEFLFHLSAHVYYLKKFYTKMSTRESPVTVMNKEHIPVEKKIIKFQNIYEIGYFRGFILIHLKKRKQSLPYQER